MQKRPLRKNQTPVHVTFPSVKPRALHPCETVKTVNSNAGGRGARAHARGQNSGRGTGQVVVTVLVEARCSGMHGAQARMLRISFCVVYVSGSATVGKNFAKLSSKKTPA